MPLFQVSIATLGDQVQQLEELFFELDESRWNIFLDQDTQVGVAAGIYETNREARDGWQRISPFIEEALGPQDPKFELLPDADWKESYKAHFKPWSFDGLHWVPIWEKETFDLPDGDAVVWLDPGMAFGTGNHETTRLCVEAFVEFVRERSFTSAANNSMSCCDAGCGSGILAISAKRVGLSHVVGFDNDPDAIRISHENAELNDLNDLDGEIEFYVAGMESGFRNQTYDLVFANILAAALVEYSGEILESVKASGRLILSGILTIEVQEVMGTFRKESERLELPADFAIHTMGEWSGIVIDLN